MKFHYPDLGNVQLMETTEGDWIAYSTDPDWVKISIRRTGVIARFPSQAAARAWYERNRQGLRVVDERTCGACHACCTPLAITELNKPPNVPCKHLGNGPCDIYAQRPLVCKDYFCGWRTGFGAETDRPDQSGIVLTAHENLELWPGLAPASFLAHEVWPDARHGELAKALMHDIASCGVMVFVIDPDSGLACQIIGPEDVLRRAARWCRTQKRMFPFGILVGYEGAFQ